MLDAHACHDAGCGVTLYSRLEVIDVPYDGDPSTLADLALHICHWALPATP